MAIKATTLDILRSAAAAVAGADVPEAPADDVAAPVPLAALEVARVDAAPEPVAAVPLAWVSLGSTADDPLAAAEEPAPPAGVVAAALVTVGTEAAGVT